MSEQGGNEAAEQIEADQINAEPTKAFFVDMLVRDIPLEQAILDLVDNSVDGAKRYPGPNANRPFDGRRIVIEFDAEHFKIVDNCGGFDKEIARKYAFRFGRPPGMVSAPHSIGQFGVGMKRALFKFGHHFVVQSATPVEEWAVDVNVPKWEGEKSWAFPWGTFGADDGLSRTAPGTSIVVTNLRPEVSSKFSTTNFNNLIVSLIKSKHRQFVSEGIEIVVNGARLDATDLYLLISDKLTPGVDFLSFEEPGKAKVDVRIVVGVGASLPREAGWYVICNGRVVLEADRSEKTGWGVVEEEAQRLFVPSFHNQFSRFRGIANFDSEDSARVPWNTTKDNVDRDSPVWRQTFERMIEMMRNVIDFLNELDKDIDENTREKSPLLDFVNKVPTKKVDTIVQKSTFSAPARGEVVKGPKFIKIQYSKNEEDIDFMQDELGLKSARSVGERTFDIVLKRLRGE